MNIRQYIAEYCEGIAFLPKEQIRCEISRVEVTVQPYIYDGGSCGAEKAHVILRRNGAVYECDCIDMHNWNKLFFPVTLSGQDYLIFRKTLYGFTLINAYTLEEAYDYFPEKVCDGGEAYIFTHAMSFCDLVVFDGCFWAFPYMHAVYDYSSKRFVLLYNEFGLEADDGDWTVQGDTLILPCRTTDGEKTELKITADEFRRMISDKGTENL